MQISLTNHPQPRSTELRSTKPQPRFGNNEDETVTPDSQLPKDVLRFKKRVRMILGTMLLSMTAITLYDVFQLCQLSTILTESRKKAEAEKPVVSPIQPVEKESKPSSAELKSDSPKTDSTK